MSTLDVQNLNINRLNVATLNVTGTIQGIAAGLNITGNNTLGNVTSNTMTFGSANITGDFSIAGNVYRNGVSVLYSPEANVSTTTYTIQTSDVGKMLAFTNTGNCAVTIPNNATVPINTYERIDLLATTNGIVSFTTAGGVTLQSYGGKTKLTGKWSVASLWKRNTDEWVLMGDTTT